MHFISPFKNDTEAKLILSCTHFMDVLMETISLGSAVYVGGCLACQVRYLCVYSVVCVIYRLYNGVIDVPPQTWGPTSRGLAPGTKGKNTNGFLWCSQQGIRRFPLTGLKQYLLVFSVLLHQTRFIPALLVILRDNVFLCLLCVGAFLCSLYPTPTFFLMVILHFGLSPPLVGLHQFCLNPEIPP